MDKTTKTTNGRAPKHFEREPSAPLAEFLDASGTTPAEFAKFCGVTPGAVHNWLRDGKMPPYCLHVIENRLRITGKAAQTILVTGPADAIDLMQGVCERSGCEVARIEC